MNAASERLSSQAHSFQSPGKIILSGEHSVVYGARALAMAVAPYARCRVVETDLDSVRIGIGLQDQSLQSANRTWSEILELYDRLDDRFRRYQAGSLSIGGPSGVLHDLHDLFYYALAHWAMDAKVQPKQGIDLVLVSDIPIGCGMGSSAATLSAFLAALASVWQQPLEQPDIHRLVQWVERLQHGCESKIDSRVTALGGLITVQDGALTGRSQVSQLPQLPVYLVNTGTPLSTTGECVARVREQFGQSTIWQDFETTTAGLERAIHDHNWSSARQWVEHNHQLLARIGVVPEAIQDFVRTLAKRCNGVAKICGAGSVSGDRAGLLMVWSEGPIDGLVSEWGYSVIDLIADNCGTQPCEAFYESS